MRKVCVLQCKQRTVSRSSLQLNAKFFKNENDAVVSKDSHSYRDKHTRVKAQAFFDEEWKRYEQCHRWGDEPHDPVGKLYGITAVIGVYIHPCHSQYRY